MNIRFYVEVNIINISLLCKHTKTTFYFILMFFGKVANKTHMIVEFFIFEKKVNHK